MKLMNLKWILVHLIKKNDKYIHTKITYSHGFFIIFLFSYLLIIFDENGI